MLVLLRIDELYGNPNRLALAENAPLQQIAGVQFLADLTQVLGAVAILHRRRAAPHAQTADLRELGEDLFVDTVGEPSVFFKPTPVLKRERCY